MVTRFFLAGMRVRISMVAIANSWPGPRVPSLARSMADVESTNTVYRWPPSCRWSMVQKAWYMAKVSMPTASLLVPSSCTSVSNH